MKAVLVILIVLYKILSPDGIYQIPFIVNTEAHRIELFWALDRFYSEFF